MVLLTVCVPNALIAQQDSKARDILDNISSAYTQAGGVSIAFDGDQQGTLLLDGKCFMLSINDVKSWFDGTTQWSYLVQSEEVNISSPTPDELQTVNPFILLSMYKAGFDCSYQGTETYMGMTLQRVKLVPTDKKSEIKHILVSSDSKNQIRRLSITDNSDNVQQIDVTAYRSGMNFDITTFRFDHKKHPDVEVIDLR